MTVEAFLPLADRLPSPQVLMADMASLEPSADDCMSASDQVLQSGLVDPGQSGKIQERDPRREEEEQREREEADRARHDTPDVRLCSHIEIQKPYLSQPKCPSETHVEIEHDVDVPATSHLTPLAARISVVPWIRKCTKLIIMCSDQAWW